MLIKDFYKNKIGILILDYNKPKETEFCLHSIKSFCDFNKEVILYSNGGDQDYVYDFYKQGLIDKCVFNKSNVGCGTATIELFKMCSTEYAIYMQNDQAFQKLLRQDYIDDLITHFNDKVKSISLAGMPCGPLIYSERAHLINVDFYNSIPNKTIGGPGPLNDIKYSEQSIQEHYKTHGFIHAAVQPFVADNGVYSIRELGGGIMKWRTDTKELCIILPPKEKIEHLNLTDDEWQTIINDEWEDWKIPKSWEKDSFKFWSIENV